MMGKGYLKLKNAAKYLDMSEKTFRLHVLPYVYHKRVGNHIYFPIKELDKFMMDNSKENQIKNKALEILKKVG